VSHELDPWADEGHRSRWGRWIALAVLLLVVGGGLAWFYFDRKDPALAAVHASAGRLTLEKDDGTDLKAIDRKEKPEVWFRVTLEDAPVGRKLDLLCEWVDPAGRVTHRNRYQTQEITRATWETHARHRLGADAPVGRWTVRLLLDGRELRTQTFEVRDGGKEGP
jgi:hypothetical protein